ncbi:hypothetical protein BO78DRAFT_397654 [Aspergillus sclerotiicarbonarius CBS 121057]|uniref:Uncharacterized protein n=1 Tax=Aspergillus sclerotiicarbonarius (strain CBS 121057 / IBT 28362) TaxID=1448318 RepID=A0A319EVY7_ASPSB|nr:hypothetical protein BO78DRAFT_397654 [Aspergillus sclerotiicarbonarius CBS 121057]
MDTFTAQSWQSRHGSHGGPINDRYDEVKNHLEGKIFGNPPFSSSSQPRYSPLLEK